MARDAANGLKSLGRTLLQGVLRERSESEVAQSIGVSQPKVSRWASGSAVPVKYLDRLNLLRRWGVPMSSWESDTDR